MSRTGSSIHTHLLLATPYCQNVPPRKPCNARVPRPGRVGRSHLRASNTRALTTTLKALPPIGDAELQTLIDQPRKTRDEDRLVESRNIWTRSIQGSPRNGQSPEQPHLLTLTGKQRRTTVGFKRIPSSSDGVDRTHAYYSRDKPTAAWGRLLEEYHKNYCPRVPPPLVLPTAPTVAEKYSYVKINRPFLVICELLAMLSLSYGAWMFAVASPIFCWFALYVVINEIYILATLFVTVLGKEIDLDNHERLLEKHCVIHNEPRTIDIYLPVCNEPLEILENTWNHISALKYPAGKMSVFVLDDGVSNLVRHMAGKFEFNYIRRPNRPKLKKAGNLRFAFAQTSAEFFAIFDADFCPRSDFLLETMPYMIADGSRAILQTPQFFRSTKKQTWVEQGAGAFQEYIYRIMQPCRDRWGAAICVGSNAVYRRAAFKPIGGTVAIDCSEDIYTGLYAITHGWTIKYLPLNLACGTSPDTPSGYFSQQMRWCHGTLSLLSQRAFWRGHTTVKVKLCYLLGAVYYITNALQPFLFPTLAPLILLTRPDLFKYYNLFWAYPYLILGFLGRKIWARSRYTLSVQYADRILAFACIQAIWNLVAGKSFSWKPGGGTVGAHKNHSYRNMRILAWGWTITHTSVLIAAAAYRVTGGLRWYNLLPTIVIELANLLWMHRFLLYQHCKQQGTP